MLCIRQQKKFSIIKIKQFTNKFVNVKIQIESNTFFNSLCQKKQNKIQVPKHQDRLIKTKMNNLVNTEITFYIRTAKKLGFIQKSKKSLLSCQQLKQLVAKKSKFPVENQVIFYNGQKVQEGKNIKIVDKAIVHVVDSRNVGKSKMKLQVKRLSQTSNSQSFEVDSNSSIDQFIQKQLSPFYQEPAEKLFFVYSGRQLKREKSFLEQYVESDTQIICVHQQKDKKPKTKVLPAQNLSKQPKKEQQKNNQKQQDQSKTNEQLKETLSLVEDTSKQQGKYPINEVKISQKDINNDAKDQRSKTMQNQNLEISETGNKQLKQDSLSLKIQEKANSKADPFDKFSQASSISEPNFKKKNKVKQISSISSKNDNSDSIPTFQLSPAVQNKSHSSSSNAQNQVTPYQNQKNNLLYKTRQEIFESNIPTYASVIDEPQDLLSFQVQENNIKASGMSFYMHYRGNNRNHDQQIFDSGMNFQKQDNSKLQVKYNKGFMNLSNASFLQTSRPESSKQNQKSSQQDDKMSELKLHNNRSQIYLNSPSLLDYSHSRTFEVRENEQSQRNSRYQQETQQIKRQGKQNQESQDNLFAQIRRGISPSHHYQNEPNHQYQISQSNLLSDTYHQPSSTDMMNSFTFNLQQNPDQTLIHQRQSNVRIILQQPADQQEVSVQALNSKRESQIETNFKDSASPSQVQSHFSRNTFDFQTVENIPTVTCSLIENLMSIDDQKTNKSTEKQSKQTYGNKSQNQKVNNNQQSSDIFVHFQQYRADTQSQVHQFKDESDLVNKQNQSKEKSSGQFEPKQKDSYRQNASNEPQTKNYQSQDSAIKIVEEDSLSIEPNVQQENFLTPAHKNILLNSEADQCSGTFQQVSYSNNPLQSNLANNSVQPDPQEITFRKDKTVNQSNFYEPQDSKLLHQLSLLAQNEPQKPQLLPGDYIYSTDLVETPQEALQGILNQFSHCF